MLVRNDVLCADCEHDHLTTPDPTALARGLRLAKRPGLLLRIISGEAAGRAERGWLKMSPSWACARNTEDAERLAVLGPRSSISIT